MTYKWIAEYLAITLTASADSVNEDGSVTYTVTASKAVTEATNVVFTLVPGSGSAADQGTTTTNLNDFGQGAFNPVTVSIPVGGTTATFTVTPPNDDKTELAESFSVQAVVAGTTLTKSATLLDGTSGAGKTYTLTVNQDSLSGTAGNDTFNAGAAQDGAGTLINTLQNVDVIDGGAGTDTLAVTHAAATTVAATIKNIENINVRFADAKADLNLANATGVTTINVADSTTKGVVTGVGAVGTA